MIIISSKQFRNTQTNKAKLACHHSAKILKHFILYQRQREMQWCKRQPKNINTCTNITGSITLTENQLSNSSQYSHHVNHLHTVLLDKFFFFNSHLLLNFHLITLTLPAFGSKRNAINSLDFVHWESTGLLICIYVQQVCNNLMLKYTGSANYIQNLFLFPKTSFLLSVVGEFVSDSSIQNTHVCTT